MTEAMTATKPDAFRIERSITIRATPDKIFPLIQDFRRWTEWSPYEGLDPAMLRTYSGPDHGVGAAYAWTSKGKAGSGGMEILAIEPDAKVTIRLDFFKPFEAHNTAEFTLTPEAAGTRVTWAMFGEKACDNWLVKLMGFFFDMEKMVGRDFEAGLAKLAAQTEA